MSKANLARSVGDWIPACQSSFNQTRCFHYVGGDSAAVIHRASLHQHLSSVDDPILEAERVRTDRFLHDVVAQCRTSTRLQVELQRLEFEGLGVKPPDRAREIEPALEETLDQIRTFHADQKSRIA